MENETELPRVLCDMTMKITITGVTDDGMSTNTSGKMDYNGTQEEKALVIAQMMLRLEFPQGEECDKLLKLAAELRDCFVDQAEAEDKPNA